jgi:hypothetical protein
MSHSDKMRQLMNLVESLERVDEKGFLDRFKKQPQQAAQPQQPVNKQQPAQVQAPAQGQQPQQPTNTDQQQQPPQQQQSGKATDNPAFKKWFGQSKIKNQNGPLRCFHGSTGDISNGVFKASNSGVFGPGIYFTSKPETASKYASGARRTGQADQDKVQGQVTPVFLKMERPFQDGSLRGNSEMQQALLKFLSGGLKGVLTKKHPEVQNLINLLKQNKAKVINVMYCYNMLMKDKQQQSFAQHMLVDVIRKYSDGIVAADSDGSAEIVVYYPNQIKSAVGNKGTFNPQSASINEEDEDDDTDEEPQETV